MPNVGSRPVATANRLIRNGTLSQSRQVATLLKVNGIIKLNNFSDKMAKEIERKFLVTDDSYRAMASGSRNIVQGYLSMRREATVRVRIADGQGYLTVKGITSGATRDEWEYPIPAADARGMLPTCEGTVIDKTRYLVPFEGRTWEVDEFHGAYEGLTVAEVELPSENERVALPPFIGREVTGDPQYYNSVMAGVSR